MKLIQSRSAFEYTYAYPASATCDEDLHVMTIGGEVLDTLLGVRTTSADDLAHAKRVLDSKSCSDGQAEWNCRITAEDGACFPKVEYKLSTCTLVENKYCNCNGSFNKSANLISEHSCTIPKT